MLMNEFGRNNKGLINQDSFVPDYPPEVLLHATVVNKVSGDPS